ncbi:MAG: hypothetical protein E7666_02860 [Ruminococcaceae bacterium]|nr:hypothetical protein [Oscillospiraceae bacterium]
MKKFICLMLCLVMCFSVSACYREAPADEGKESGSTDSDSEQSESDTEAESEPDPIPTAVIGETVIYMMEGEEYKLNFNVSTTDGKSDGYMSEIQWVSSDPETVSVRNGVLTAHRDGYAIVTGGGDEQCVVRVIPREMPTISVNTNGKPIVSRDEYTPCLIDMDSTNPAFCFDRVSGEIRYRGNSTYDCGDKKPYRIKFSSKRNVLGMNEGAECKSWVLLAEYFDNSMVRNSTCLSLASAIVTEYTSDWRYVRFELNGKFIGVFLLAEQAQINENRVNIEEAGKDSDALESGYMFELDQSPIVHEIEVKCTDYYFHTLWGKLFDSRTLRYKVENNGLSAAQMNFINKYMNNAFDVVYYATYENKFYALDENYELVPSDKTNAKDVIAEVLDIESLVRKYILDELICNHDAHQKSYYMHVDFSENGNGLLTFSCPWDYDFTMYKWSNDVWEYEYYDPEAFMQAKRATWYVMMLNHEWFRDMVTSYWNVLYRDNKQFMRQLDLIETISDAYAADFAEDRVLWGRKHAQDQQAQIVLEWLTTRMNWFNETIAKGNYLIESKS